MRHRHKFKLRKETKKFILAGLAFFTVIFVILYGVKFWENEKFGISENNETAVQSRDSLRYNGASYKENDNIDTILFIGLDKYNKSAKSDNYINDQQADFLLLVSIDRASKNVSAIQINRDTMTEVSVLGVGGDEADTQIMQIALSHTYGSGGSDSCINTVNAVSNLLYGVNIDHYVSLTMDAVKSINDSLGGVTVKVEDDFSGVDDTLVFGKEVTLIGEHALNFVRARSGMNDSTNIRRMARQRQYLNALVAQMKYVYEDRGEDAFYDTILSVSSKMTTDYTNAQMKKLISTIYDFKFSGMQTIEGETKLGDEFVEFYADDEKLKQLVVDNYYVLDDITA